MSTLQINQYLASQSLSYLGRLVRNDGRFVYLHNGLSGLDISDQKYNILRHAGSIWALNVVNTVLPFELKTAVASARALDYLLSNHLRKNTNGHICVVERDIVKLGASALTLLALLSYSDDTLTSLNKKHGSDVDICHGLSEYLMTQIDHSNHFVHKVGASDGKAFDFRSDYYDGQALFAIISLFERHPPKGTSARIVDVLRTSMANFRKTELQVHWMMYAVGSAYNVLPLAEIFTYAEKLVEVILNDCSYRNGEHCTSIACRSEALAVYLKLCRRARTIGRHFADASYALAENIQIQLKSRLANGAFCRSPSERIVRIDYMQHNISALIGYLQLSRHGRGILKPTPTPNTEIS